MTTLLLASAPPNDPPRETAVAKRQGRAAEYRRLANAAGALAEASLLIHVREKHELAAARWTALAMLEEEPKSLPVSPGGKPRLIE